MIPTINNPTRVMRSTATATDHIAIKTVKKAIQRSGIIKPDISNHLPTVFGHHTGEKSKPWKL